MVSGIKLELIALKLATPIDAESAITLPLKYRSFQFDVEVPKS